MKDFFIQCLKELKEVNGSDQLHWLQQDPEGAKRKDVLILGMMEVSKKFDYIPESYQQKYIRKMMVEDQQYNLLNSRQIWKWLDLHKDKHMTTPKISEQEMLPAVAPEVADKYLAEMKSIVDKIGKPEFKNGMKELRQEQGIVSVMIESRPGQVTTVEELRKRDLHHQWIRENHDAISGKQKKNWVSEMEWMKQHNETKTKIL